MDFEKRKAGVLLHISCLPNKYGIGTFGKEAYEFVDFLKQCGFSVWQILPLNPIGLANSPYCSYSTYAGNIYFIDFDLLCEDGFLSENDYSNFSVSNVEKVDYDAVCKYKQKILEIAVSNFLINIKINKMLKENFNNFLINNFSWLCDYAIYMVLREKFNIPWYKFSINYKNRDEKSLEEIKIKYEKRIYFYYITQYFFYSQWFKLKKYANDNNINIFGDMPIYVSYDSVECYVDRKVFQFNEKGEPFKVSGCPPDDYAPNGQLWGNPLYDFEYLKKENYSWWLWRLAHLSKTFDIIRIDHFRAFDEYYAVPSKDIDAKNGKWEKGPGKTFFDVVKSKLKNINIVAEDLGFITDSVRKLLYETDIPGMRVLQFAFSDDQYMQNMYIPENYDIKTVSYTGTHDNDTIIGFLENGDKNEASRLKQYLSQKNLKSIELNFKCIEAVFESHSFLSIVPVQDLFSLSSEARMNTPGTTNNNWEYRLFKNYNKDERVKNKIKKIIIETNRI